MVDQCFLNIYRLMPQVFEIDTQKIDILRDESFEESELLDSLAEQSISEQSISEQSMFQAICGHQGIGEPISVSLLQCRSGGFQQGKLYNWCEGHYVGQCPMCGLILHVNDEKSRRRNRLLTRLSD